MKIFTSNGSESSGFDTISPGYDASTDDIIVDPDKEPVIDSESEDEEQMMEYRLRKAYEDSARRIIDLKNNQSF